MNFFYFSLNTSSKMLELVFDDFEFMAYSMAVECGYAHIWIQNYPTLLNPIMDDLLEFGKITEENIKFAIDA